jgi:hypothetical protein
VRNHAGAILACDFFVTITARFRALYVFVVLDVGTRRIVHWNVTEHPTPNGPCNSSVGLCRVINRNDFSSTTATASTRMVAAIRLALSTRRDLVLEIAHRYYGAQVCQDLGRGGATAR